jgi:micrococcal nuclease
MPIYFLIIALLLLIKVTNVTKLNTGIMRNITTQNQSFKPTVSLTPTIIPKEKALVAKVFDGDTVLLTDGRHVRYLGIDTPEMGKEGGKNQCFALEAKHINEQMVQNQEIEMEKDQEDKDKYGRLLRYIWVDNVFVNEFMLRQGFARFDVFPQNARYREEFRQAAEEAKRDKRGLWQVCIP